MEFNERSLKTLHIAEPNLSFKNNQVTDHPKDGLYLYGPSGENLGQNITVGVVGTSRGLGFFREWASNLCRKVNVPPPTAREKVDRLHLSDFPGFQEAFGVQIDPSAFVEYPVSAKEIDVRTSLSNKHEAVAKTVELYVGKVNWHKRNEERSVDVWIFVVPEEVYKCCRQEARRSHVKLSNGEFAKRQSRKVDLPLLAGIVDQSSEEIFDDVPDFHRQIKAKLLHEDAPSQLVRETTIAPKNFLNNAGYPIRGTQDPATICWNFATGLYYKTQPDPPWKMAEMRPGVCYVGLVFKIIPNHPKKYACCAAQMFLSEGDGVVFRGANGPWQTSKWEFHLSTVAAKALIKTVLDTYKAKFGEFPRELFIHGRTKFNHEEWRAFEEIAPTETNIVGVRIRSDGGEMKLFRDGDYPCIRGTAILLDERNAYLWTSGYLPRLDTYIGPETPNPLNVTILRSTSDLPEMEAVLRDIMGLTKINYNACNYSDSLPVTIRFADKVGDVLVMGSAKGAERQPFKYYI